MVALLLYLMLAPPACNGWVTRPERELLFAIWIGNAAILVWKHRADFRVRPRLRIYAAHRGEV
jgi:hypothetical protein